MIYCGEAENFIAKHIFTVVSYVLNTRQLFTGYSSWEILRPSVQRPILSVEGYIVEW